MARGGQVCGRYAHNFNAAATYQFLRQTMQHGVRGKHYGGAGLGVVVRSAKGSGLAAVWLLGRTLVRTLAVLAAGAAAATGAASSMSSVAEQASSAVRAKGEENTLAVPVVLCARALCCRGLEVFIAE